MHATGAGLHRYVNRVLVMHAFSVARQGQHRCTANVTWRRLRPHCCGKAARGEGRGNDGGHLWPVWYSTADVAACPHMPPADLMKKGRWPGLGIDLHDVSLVEQA